MKILYAAMEYDYGDPLRGKSFEEHAFHDSFLGMGHELIRFDFKALEQRHGRAQMNRMLLELVNESRSDLLFTVLFKNEIDRNTIRKISQSGKTMTFNWFCDDHWRYESFSRLYAPCYNWVSTTDAASLAKYHRDGIHNVMLTQWAVNPYQFKDLGLEKAYDVTFVGQPYGKRKNSLEMLKSEGISVRSWGFGTPNGRVDQESMIRIFNQSRINLNFSSAYRNSFAFWRRRGDQIKARNFEIPGAKGFQLTSRIDGIERYFDVGREIVCYNDDHDLARLTKYYLVHEDERRLVTEAGYRRVQSEHTYTHRFAEIFEIIFGR